MDVRNETAFLFHRRILFVVHSYIHHARVKTKLVIVKTVRDTSLRTNWCEVLMLHKYLNKNT